MGSRILSVSANWNDVWAEYDARQPAPAVVAPVPAPIATQAASARPAGAGRRFGWATLLALPLLAAGWLSAPYATAWTLVHALDGRDAKTLVQHLDLPAMQATLRDSLRLGPDTPQDGPAATYLRAMAGDIAAAWSSPMALAEVARARGVAPGAAKDALGGTLPTGLTRFEIPLAATLAPLALQLELTGEALAPRWQVTGVRLEAMTAMPTYAPSPMRLR